VDPLSLFHCLFALFCVTHPAFPQKLNPLFHFVVILFSFHLFDVFFGLIKPPSSSKENPGFSLRALTYFGPRVFLLAEG